MDFYEKLKRARKAQYVRRPGVRPKAIVLAERNRTKRKLTDKQAKAIRHQHFIKGVHRTVMARALKVASGTIDSICRYETYRDCGGPCNIECELASGDEWACVTDHEA